MVYHERALHNYFIPHHRNALANAINVTYARCMMGRLMQYRRIFNGFPVFRLAAFSMGDIRPRY